MNQQVDNGPLSIANSLFDHVSGIWKWLGFSSTKISREGEQTCALFQSDFGAPICLIKLLHEVFLHTGAVVSFFSLPNIYSPLTPAPCPPPPINFFGLFLFGRLHPGRVPPRGERGRGSNGWHPRASWSLSGGVCRRIRNGQHSWRQPVRRVDSHRSLC